MLDSDQLLCLFSAEAKEENGKAVIEVPERELDMGDVEIGETYRVGLYRRDTEIVGQSSSEPQRSGRSDRDEPPVEEGEVVDVEIEDLGEEGDGIARVGPGYVVFIPDTKPGERAAVKITTVRENVAFGEVVERYDR
jgi:predicted RNA-binding protein with TRAM domain